MRTRFLPFVAIACFAISTPTTAADSPVTGLYRAECGSCHDAYPARLLGATSWGRVLDRLDAHYGVDASLDEVTVQAVARALGVTTQPAAASRVEHAQALPRITQQPWFVDEHDEITVTTFRSSKIGSAANCSACHLDAEHGDFDDDSVRIPR